MDKDDFKEEKTNWFNEKMKNSKIFKFTVIIIVLCIVQIGFAGYGIIVKATAQNNNINPLVFSLVRDLACFPLLLICACLVEGFQKPQLKHLPVIFILGLLLFGNQFFFILGLYQTNSPSIASIFQPSIPVITTIFSLIFRLEPLDLNRIRGWAKILGVLSATGGAVVMILDSAEHSSIPLKQAIFGELLLLMNCVCMAAYVTIQKQFLFKQEGTKVISIYPPVSLTAWIYGFTAISMAVSVIYYVVSDRSVFDLDTSILIPCFYAVFISSGLCFVLITWANKQTSPTIVTAFWPVQVPVTVVLSAMIFQSQLNWHHYLGAFLIISGLLLVCWAKHNLEKEQEEIKYTKLQEEIN